MSRFIVITSIYQPTEAVKAFCSKKGYRVIVVGDKKTPDDWVCQGADFIGAAEQVELGYALEPLLPHNHYCRKMLGYLRAVQNGALVIVDTDDDNIPYDFWEIPDFEGVFEEINSSQGFVNVYSLFTSQPIWPRGLPLRLVNQPNQFTLTHGKPLNVGVWQGLADEDPDVDAIYRLTNDAPCNFIKRSPVCLDHQTFSPFNSQNTAFRREMFPLLYLPTSVTFRYTDILRSTVAQPIMWDHGFCLGFTQATVVQKRNPHDYTKDFESEVPMYLTNERAASIVMDSLTPNRSVKEQLMDAYVALVKADIVLPQEITTVQAWLDDLNRLSQPGT